MLNFYIISGSGSTYIYGHCDATFKPKMTKDECYRFVANGKSFIPKKLHNNSYVTNTRYA